MNDFIIKKIKIKNFRAFRDFTFDTEGKNIVFITGRNGQGKTTIFDAIEWCFTGEVKKVFEPFLDRNKNQTEKKNCITGIIQNKGSIGKITSVSIDVDYECQGEMIEVNITRTTEIDTHKKEETKIEVKCEDNMIEKEVKLKLENFYQNNICDKHKEIKFLNSSRENIYYLFKDFLKDRKEITVPDIIHTLNTDIDEKISGELLKLENKVETKEKELDTINSFEIIEYPKEKLYKGEQIDTSKIGSEQFKESVQILKSILKKETYIRVEQLYKSSEASEEKIRITAFISNYNKSRKDIDRVYVQHMNDKSFISKKEEIIKSIDNFVDSINIENIKINTINDVISKNKMEFNCISEEIIKGIKENCLEIKGIEDRIEQIGKSSNITKSLLTLVENRQSFIDYKNQGNDNCPLCGSSENFKDDTKICLEAKEYLNKVDKQKLELSSDRQMKVELIKKNINELIINPLNRQKQSLEEEVKSNKEIINENKALFLYLETKECVCENILETLHNEIKAQNHIILKSEEQQKISNELNEIYNSQKLDKSQLTDISSLYKALKQEEPNIGYVKLGIDIIIKKFLSLTLQQKNTEKIELIKQLGNLNKEVSLYSDLKDGKFDKFIKLKQFKENYNQVLKLKKEADTKLLSLQKREIEEVGGMVNYVFQKLMKNNNIGDVKLISLGKTIGKSEIKDSAETNVLNTLSQGQMSVLMISYFIANLTIRRDKNIPVYLFDDITQSMDDLNVNSFIDVFKYMLSDNTDRLISQLFITTHDVNLVQLFEQKVASRNLEYKTYNFDEEVRKK